jgi:hypothetical protein
MGRDVVAYVNQTSDNDWDNFQCKHYKDALQPSDIWCELGKLCYYTFISAYTVPRKYYFVAPRGVGNMLSNLLHSPQDLKKRLLEEWDKHCKCSITSTKEIRLDMALQAHIDNLDFSKFESKPPLVILDEHRNSPYHAARFGGGLPQRPSVPPPPVAIADIETHYVRALLDAYEDRLRSQLSSPNELNEPTLVQHFQRSRREFYNAEALRAFSRDNVPPGTFEGLLDEVYDGIIDEVESSHRDGLERVLAVVKQAKTLALTRNALLPRVSQADRGGMCHKLANDKRVKWRS